MQNLEFVTNVNSFQLYFMEQYAWNQWTNTQICTDNLQTYCIKQSNLKGFNVHKSDPI
jgi:hypothetical protein